MATLTIKKVFETPSEVITALMTSHVNECTDAGCGMFKYDTIIMGIPSIVQSYLRGVDFGNCYVIFYHQMEDGNLDNDTFAMGNLPLPIQWGIAMKLAKEFNEELNCPYTYKNL